MIVVKRNGVEVPYDIYKPINAIKRANKEVSRNERISIKDAKQIAKDIGKCGRVKITVEEIQDLVEFGLMKHGKFNLAKKYILYRYIHGLFRGANSIDDSVIGIVDADNKDVLEENSNKDSIILSTQRDLIAGEVSKDLTWRVLLPHHISSAEAEAVLHFHDADYFVQHMINCCLIDVKDMLDNGTVINGNMIESPKSFRVVCTVLTQFMAVVASNQFGGQSVNIKHLGKYVDISYKKHYKRLKKKFGETLYKKYYNEGYKQFEKYGDEAEKRFKEFLNWEIDDLAKEEALEILRQEIKDGVQTIQYQLNTLVTTNGQSPFVTLFLELDEDDPYVEYTAMIIEEIFNQRIQGIKDKSGKYVSPAFPKLIYVLDEHNTFKGGKYDYLTKLAAECSAKRMVPDYISAKKMREYYDGEVFSCMGCRSFLSPWKKTEKYVKERGEDLSEIGKYKWEGRFNMGVVSLNLPQIAILSKGDYTKFWELFEERVDLCIETLMCRYRALKGTLSDVSPIHWQYGALARLKPGEKIDKYLEDGYATISLGYIGIYEMSLLMTGKSHTSDEGREFAIKVMNRLKERCEIAKSETGLGFGLYGTPAESLCYKFARKDAELYGNLIPKDIYEDIVGKGYYTNSYHVDVREPIDAFSKLSFESQFQDISSGGAISYVEVPNLVDNIDAVIELIKFIYDNIKYAEINTRNDICLECDFEGEITTNSEGVWECPCCGNKNQKTMKITRRTCGYIGTFYWNVGKTKEINSRVVHL